MQTSRRHAFLRLPTAALLALLSVSGFAADARLSVTVVPPGTPPAATGAGESGSATAAFERLARVGEAWRTGNFRGRIVYVRGNRMDSMQVVHALIDGLEHERISHLDDTASEVIRRGDETFFVHPDAQVTRLDAAGAGSPFPAFTLPAADVSRVYVVRNAGRSRVSGRTAERIDVVPRDNLRYGYRFWIDSASGLPLRHEVVGRKGQAIESAEFVDLETGIVVPRAMFEAAAAGESRALRIVRMARGPMPPVVPSWLPPGFRVTGSETQRQGDAGTPVSAAAYSDGLATFSLFVEPAPAGMQPAARQVGPTVAVSGVLDAAPAGRFLVTLVGEIPAGTAVRIVEGARLATPALGAGRQP